MLAKFKRNPYEIKLEILIWKNSINILSIQFMLVIVVHIISIVIIKVLFLYFPNI